MSTVWIICGAGRGVGKTTLATKLCALLPSSCYAKYGHSDVQDAKPEHYFTDEAALKLFVDEARTRYEHIIVESNAWARAGCGDVTIYIDGICGCTNIRPDADALRARSDIHVAAGVSLAAWRALLQRVLTVPATCDAVAALLHEQQQYLFNGGLYARTKIWFEVADAHVFGPGLARLLEQIDRCGSLQSAVATEEMSYRYAWKLIRLAEKHFGKPLLHRQAGGAHGGQSVLTKEGVYLLKLFRQLEGEVAAYARERFRILASEENCHVQQ